MSKERVLHMRRTKHGLQPSNHMTAEILAQFPMGDLLRVKVSKPRNIRHHDLYWSMLGKIAANTEWTKDGLNDWIKLKLGYVIQYLTPDGWEIKPGSISFDNMDQTAFKEFFDRVEQLVCTKIIPELDSDDLKRELIDMMGG